MAARRRKRKRGRRNRGRFGFLYKILSAVLIIAAILVGCVVFFKVDTIVVVGASRYTEQGIIDVSGVTRGDNLFRINKSQVANQVLTKLPYVDTLSISRKLPDTLILTMTECVPIGAVQCGDEWWLIDAKCKLLERGDATLAVGRGKVTGITPLSPAVGATLAVGDADKQRLKSISELLAALYARGLSDKLDFTDLTADNVIRFGYENRLTIEMPMITDFSAAVYQFSRTLETMAENGDGETGGTLSFMYEDGAHLFPRRWMPGEAAPAETAPAVATGVAPTPTPAPAVQ